jgi:hypothetical protein
MPRYDRPGGQHHRPRRGGAGPGRWFGAALLLGGVFFVIAAAFLPSYGLQRHVPVPLDVVFGVLLVAIVLAVIAGIRAMMR